MNKNFRVKILSLTSLTILTLLHVASQKCYIDFIEFIFKRSPADKAGITLMHLAAVFDYRTRANKGRANYSKILILALRLSHKNHIKIVF